MKGSLWNRWELHMHTPQTKKNDRFKGGDIDEKWENYYKWIDEYIDENNPEKNIKALAVTDYLSIDNFLLKPYWFSTFFISKCLLLNDGISIVLQTVSFSKYLNRINGETELTNIKFPQSIKGGTP